MIQGSPTLTGQVAIYIVSTCGHLSLVGTLTTILDQYIQAMKLFQATPKMTNSQQIMKAV